MAKYAVLLKGAHKLDETIQLEVADIVASALYQEHAERTVFPDVPPIFKGDTVDNIVQSAGIADTLDGEAQILADLTTDRLPITPNCGDIYMWNPTAPADSPQGGRDAGRRRTGHGSASEHQPGIPAHTG